MDEKVCLDTNLCIEVLKNTEKGIELLDLITKKEVFITTITVFELFLREKNIYPIERFLSNVNILEFSELSARAASEVLKTLKRKGKLIDIRDLFIASVALTNSCTLATLNIKHFKNIENLKLLKV